MQAFICRQHITEIYDKYTCYTEGLITEFQCVTVSYGIQCSFWVIITHECA